MNVSEKILREDIQDLSDLALDATLVSFMYEKYRFLTSIPADYDAKVKAQTATFEKMDKEKKRGKVLSKKVSSCVNGLKRGFKG